VRIDIFLRFLSTEEALICCQQFLSLRYLPNALQKPSNAAIWYLGNYAPQICILQTTMRGVEVRTKRAYGVGCHLLKGARDYSISSPTSFDS
jgi:hypothetical protein